MATRFEPKYCSKCGDELVIISVEEVFDIYTREKFVQNFTLQCPQFKQRFLWSNGHDSYWATKETVGYRFMEIGE